MWSYVGIGIGLGWLVGLSESPVVAATIAFVTGLVMLVAKGVGEEGEGKLADLARRSAAIPPSSVAGLTLALALGATLGLTARVGVFPRLVPAPTQGQVVGNDNGVGLLNGVSPSSCAQLRAAPSGIRRAFERLSEDALAEIASHVPEDSLLLDLRDALCPTS